MTYRQTTACGYIATCLCKVTARLQAAVKKVLAGVSLSTVVTADTEIDPLHVGRTLTVNIPTHLQLRLSGFHL